MMIDTPASCALYCLFARESRLAVIYRRGPTRQTCLILWDRARDTFEIGQWFKGKVYPHRGGISPNGHHLLTFMGKHTPPFRSYTVLSRPPYFTALTLWPMGTTYGGGGRFLSDSEIVLHHGYLDEIAPGFALPKGFVVLDGCDPAVSARYETLHLKDPLAWQATERLYTVSIDDGPDLGLTAELAPRGAIGTRAYTLRNRKGDFVIEGAEWADLDTNGDLLFSLGGRLHRCRRAEAERVRGEAELTEASRLLHDFAPLVYRPVPAPYGPAQPETEPFPRLDRITKEDRRARVRARKERG